MSTARINIILLIFFQLIFNCSAFADLNTGIVAYYPFNGNANDESGNGNNGDVYGAVLTKDRFGKNNSAYYFDGKSYINVKNSLSLNSISDQYTVSVWANTFSWDNGLSSLVCKGIYSAQYRPQFSVDGRFLFQNYVDVYTNYHIELNKWYLIVEVWSNGIAQVYIDGQKIGEAYGEYPVNVNNDPLEIGRDQPGAIEYMNGMIDDIRIYNRALSASEVKQLYEKDCVNQHVGIKSIPAIIKLLLH